MDASALSCRKRILLSGTPLQNDLEEFYAMVRAATHPLLSATMHRMTLFALADVARQVDFTNPGILGTPNEFRKNVVRHILAGREPDATDAQVARAQE